jgi:hypothetical protein
MSRVRDAKARARQRGHAEAIGQAVRLLDEMRARWRRHPPPSVEAVLTDVLRRVAALSPKEPPCAPPSTS